MATQSEKNQLIEVIKMMASELLNGTLPKIVKGRLLNAGVSEAQANRVMEYALKEANMFSHYKIGGKYCKENKHQTY